jgi:hypothetical protein
MILLDVPQVKGARNGERQLRSLPVSVGWSSGSWALDAAQPALEEGRKPTLAAAVTYALEAMN